MYEAFRNLAIAIAASRRLGWIALGLYIVKMNLPPPGNPFYKSILDYHRYMGSEYEFHESIMRWADDYRMVFFPHEFSMRLDAIDDEWFPYHIKEMQKAQLIRRMQRARNELENIW